MLCCWTHFAKLTATTNLVKDRLIETGDNNEETTAGALP
jgi:hypothetical protein